MRARWPETRPVISTGPSVCCSALATTFSRTRASSPASACATGSGARTEARSRVGEPCQDVGHEVVEADVAEHRGHRARLQPAHVEEVHDDRRQPLGALLHGAQQGAAVVRRELLVGAAQGLDTGTDARRAACAGRGTPRRGARSGCGCPLPAHGPRPSAGRAPRAPGAHPGGPRTHGGPARPPASASRREAPPPGPAPARPTWRRRSRGRAPGGAARRRSRGGSAR